MYLIKPLTKSDCLLWLCLALLAGCGQRGPLYLPEQGSVTPPSQEQAQDQAELQDEMQDGEPAPDIVPDPVPEPAAVKDDE